MKVKKKSTLFWSFNKSNNILKCFLTCSWFSMSIYVSSKMYTDLSTRGRCSCWTRIYWSTRLYLFSLAFGVLFGWSITTFVDCFSFCYCSSKHVYSISSSTNSFLEVFSFAWTACGIAVTCSTSIWMCYCGWSTSD